MKHLLNVFFIFNLISNLLVNVSVADKKCETIINSQYKSVTFQCTEQTNLNALKKARTNTTNIEISDSRISNVSGNSFTKFGATLVTLDLHGSRIENIDLFAFIGLIKLENLLLWDNKLRIVPGNWFVNLYNLKTLDLSFNYISVIDYVVFTLLPNLENFYFDYNQIKVINYNMFQQLRNLKNVKFEKNPLDWEFRAQLIWQLENQHVKYDEDWENWGWMNKIIKECSENVYEQISKDKILDCIVEKLLNYTYEIFSTEMIQQNVDCSMKARQLVRCTRPKNVMKNTDNAIARSIIEDYAMILPEMSRSNVRFSTSKI